MSRASFAGLLALVLLVTAAHLAAVSAEPLVIYGNKGAEYLEHLQREHALHLAAGHTLFGHLAALPDHLALLDGEYPALLHLSAALAARLLGDGLTATLALNLGWLMLLAGATGLFTRELVGNDAPHRAEAAQGVATCLGLLAPGALLTARRYYYDLPLAAWVALGLFTAARARSTAWGWAGLSVVSALACLTKWQAGLYLAPVWVWAAAGWWTRRGRGGLWVVGCALVGWGVGVGPLLWRAWGASTGGGQSSLLTALGQGGIGGRGGGEAIRRLWFYVEGGPASITGWMLGAALIGVVVGAGRTGWGSIGRAAAMAAPPILVLIAGVRPLDERFLLPLLPLVLSGCVAAWASAGAPRWGGGLLVGAALLQWGLLDGLRMPLARPPVDNRGWSLRGALAPSPAGVYEDAARLACAEGGHRLGVEAEVWEPAVHAWRWAAARHCPGWEVGPVEADTPGLDSVIGASPWGGSWRWRPTPVPGAPGGQGGVGRRNPTSGGEASDGLRPGARESGP